MGKTPTDEDLIDFTRFVATKFTRNATPWVYTRETGDLVHIRYKRDYTGYNHWTKRFARAFSLRELFETEKSFARRIGLDSRNRSLKGRLLYAWAHIIVHIRKESNLPDGMVNGILTTWEEDGEYIAMMGPTVGVKVLDFLEAEPDNKHAKAILAAMREAHSASWGKKNDKE